MNIKKSILSTILLVLVVSNVLGQSATPPQASTDGSKGVDEKIDKKAREKKALALIDEILKEAPNLRLPENRIRLQAGAADLLWKHDEKRARALFKQAMDALGDLIAEMRAPSRTVSRSSEYPALVQVRTELRREILQMIAQHDPRLARDFLRGTRQSAQAGEGKQERDNRERNMELELAGQIAATDPSQALQIAQESLDNGPLQEELPGIIQQLATKDRDAAAKLIAELMKRLRAVNLSADGAAWGVALALLRMATNREEDDSDSGEKWSNASNPPQILDERTLGELVDLVVAGALATPSADPQSEGGYSILNNLEVALGPLMPEIEKYAPSRAAALKKKFAEINKNLAPEMRAMRERGNGVDSRSVDGLLEAATKASPEVRDSLWTQAAMKALGEGDAERARQIVIEHCSDSDRREALIEQIDSQALMRATEAGRLDEARQLLSQASIEERVAVLTQFATRASTKGDKKNAILLLEEARDLVGAQAANGGELNALLGIARTYATVEPARSFDIIEPIVDHLNRLVAAAAIVDGFEFAGYFKDGELLQKQQSPLLNLVFQCAEYTATLARTDFERATAVADKFQSSDVRLDARLAVARGILSDNLPARISVPVSGRYYSGPMVVHVDGRQIFYQRPQ